MRLVSPARYAQRPRRGVGLTCKSHRFSSRPCGDAAVAGLANTHRQSEWIAARSSKSVRVAGRIIAERI